MEIVKFIMFYGLEIVVVGLVGLTLLAGLYQLVRNKIGSHAPDAERRSQPSQPSPSSEAGRLGAGYTEECTNTWLCLANYSNSLGTPQIILNGLSGEMFRY
jgi:hypothetical protein